MRFDVPERPIETEKLKKASMECSIKNFDDGVIFFLFLLSLLVPCFEVTSPGIALLSDTSEHTAGPSILPDTVRCPSDGVLAASEVIVAVACQTRGS